MKKIIITLLSILILVPSFARAAQNPLAGARLNVNIEQPGKAFPDGKACINADFEALNKDGVFLKNEPLIFSKSSSIKITNSQGLVKNTSDGSDLWCISSTSPIRSQITVKLANYPMVRRVFNVNFQVNRTITDMTERSLFIRKTPIVFTAKIDPSLVNGIKTAQLKYTYTRRYNSWGFWRKRVQTDIRTLKCDSEGYCSATMTGDFSKSDHNQTGYFSYTFYFVDKNGISFSRTYQGRLK